MMSDDIWMDLPDGPPFQFGAPMSEPMSAERYSQIAKRYMANWTAEDYKPTGQERLLNDAHKHALELLDEVDRLTAERDKREQILRDELAVFDVTPNADFEGIVSSIRDAVACEELRQDLITRYACPECNGSGGFAVDGFIPCEWCGGGALDHHDAEGREEVERLTAERDGARATAERVQGSGR